MPAEVGSSIPAIDTPSKAAQTSRNVTLQSLASSSITSTALFVAEVVLFLLLRRRLTALYHPRAPPSQDDHPGLFSWIKPVFWTEDSYILQNSGLDAFLFLRYLRTIIKIFIPIAAAILPILLPLSVAHGKVSKAGVQGLNRLTWGGVGLDHSSYYWAYLVLALVVVIQACYTICGEFQFYVQIRQEHLSSRTTLHTVLVSDIPHHLCSKDELSAIYEKVVGNRHRIWINRDCKMLERTLKQRDCCDWSIS